MGWTYEVSVWAPTATGGGYKYESVWTGESFLVALYVMWKKKRHGYKCVKLEWRA